MSVVDNLKDIRKDIPQNVCLVAVSKTKPNSVIADAYEAGQRVFGENKVQELTDKNNSLPSDIQWHMIGHLQSNKVKFIAPFVSLIHAVDSMKLLKTIHKEAVKNKREIDCLIQVHIAQEENKFGFYKEEVADILEKQSDYENVNVVGLMGMATFSNDSKLIRSEFKNLNSLFSNLQTKFPQLKTLSMGMSGDYKIAIEEGSNMIRIGSSIFGAR
jgi:PLP dependent protein